MKRVDDSPRKSPKKRKKPLDKERRKWYNMQAVAKKRPRERAETERRKVIEN
jgi:hypothetical protein